MAHIALVFPGMSYGHASPGLLLPELALQQLGAAVVRVSYPVVAEWTGEQPFWTADRQERFFTDVRGQVDDAFASRPERVTLVGKSLGTHALSSLVDDPRLAAGTDAIWLTPLLREDEVFDAAQRAPWRSLYVVGLADAAHDRDRQASLAAEVLELEGADHGFEVAGDVLATVDSLRLLTERVLRFVEARPPPSL